MKGKVTVLENFQKEINIPWVSRQRVFNYPIN